MFSHSTFGHSTFCLSTFGHSTSGHSTFDHGFIQPSLETKATILTACNPLVSILEILRFTPKKTALKENFISFLFPHLDS
jgi:hypothetical protein